MLRMNLQLYSVLFGVGNIAVNQYLKFKLNDVTAACWTCKARCVSSIHTSGPTCKIPLEIHYRSHTFGTVCSYI
jgi:hypothetical protein